MSRTLLLYTFSPEGTVQFTLFYVFFFLHLYLLYLITQEQAYLFHLKNILFGVYLVLADYIFKGVFLYLGLFHYLRSLIFRQKIHP